MNCKQCGASIDDGQKFCPNCGAFMDAELTAPLASADAVDTPATDVQPAADTASAQTGDAAFEPAADSIDSVPEAAAAPVASNPMPSSEAPQPQNPIPNANSYANPYPTNAIPNGVPYDPTTNPIPPMNGQQPKKKKKVMLIVLLICIPVLLILIAVACVVVFGVSLGTKGAEAVDDYWTAYVNGSGEDMAEMVPDTYWDYISETYDLTEDEAVACMNMFLADSAEQLGGNLRYDWSQKGVQVGFGSSNTLDDVKDAINAYGLDCSSGIGVGMDATITGESDTDEQSFAVWEVKIDGDWYNVTVMTDFDTVCSSSYADNAKNAAEFGDAMDSFWMAFSSADASAMSTMVPEAFWDFLSNQYAVDQTTAEGYLTQYLQDGLTQAYGSTDDLSIVSTITSVEAYEEEDLATINEGMEEFGLSGDAVSDVYVDLAITNADGNQDDSTYVTMTSIGDSWYVYDAMYYFVDACNTYGEA